MFHQAAEARQEGRTFYPCHLVNMFLDLPASLSVLQEACSCHAYSVWIAAVISPTQPVELLPRDLFFPSFLQ